jgi:hypothetical protein
MAEAAITLKLTPSEFDLLREGLKQLAQIRKDEAKLVTPKERHNLLQQAARLSDLHSRLR